MKTLVLFQYSPALNWIEITGNEFYVLCSSQRSHLFLFNYVRNEWSNANKIKTDLRKKSYIVCQKFVYRTPQKIEIFSRKGRLNAVVCISGYGNSQKVFSFRKYKCDSNNENKSYWIRKGFWCELKKWNHSFKIYFTPLHGFVVLVLFSVELKFLDVINHTCIEQILIKHSERLPESP